MIRLPDHAFTDDVQRGRDELSEAWTHLATAAEQTARQVEHATRRRGALARDRAAAVRRAARGDRRESPWRWLGVGLAAGLVLGAAGATALIRRRGGDQPEPGSEHTAMASLGERASTAVAGVRGQASVAVHSATSAVQGAASAAKGAAEAARDTVGKVRNKIGGDANPEADPEAGPPPTAPEPKRSS
jgi:ElaB/YqjD/DUF883 family membrane-anchored ribosome-binding protein